MDEVLKAAVFFWLPFALVPFGVWVAQIKSAKITDKLGYLVAVVGGILVLASPWTVPESPSSAVGQLIGFIVGPVILILFGLFNIAYSGNVPVGRLSTRDRYFGLLSFILGIIWLSLMHWWELTPVVDGGEINPYWLVFLPNLLLSLTCLAMAGGLAMIAFGDSRTNESKYLFSASALSFTFIICAMNFDSPKLEAISFREYVWLSIADLIGILIGALLAILSFALVIFIYEKSIPSPESIDAPNAEELAHVSEVITQNIGGDE
tara:strand:+ start:12854 stop:13645 length:792 start_codon:yes stop_codon:yes gene_type:complete